MLGDRHDGNPIGACLIEGAQRGKEVGRCLDEVACRTEIDHGASGGRYAGSKRKQRFPFVHVNCAEPDTCLRRVVACELTWRLRLAAGLRNVADRLAQHGLDRLGRNGAGAQQDRRLARGVDDGGFQPMRCRAAIEDEPDACAQVNMHMFCLRRAHAS